MFDSKNELNFSFVLLAKFRENEKILWFFLFFFPEKFRESTYLRKKVILLLFREIKE